MPPEALQSADVEACRTILRAGSKSFSAAARLLPPRVRDSATVLYAFCRVVDDAIDCAPAAPGETLDALRARLDRIYASRADDDPVDRALEAVVRRDRVPRVLFDALLEGMAWDTRGVRYETVEDLYGYAARVAGTVGVMMCVVMERRAPAVLARACELGIAMQLTNIARDVGEDARQGRLYLPLQWMREVGPDPDTWLAGAPDDANDAKIAPLVLRLLGVADALYARAEGGIGQLPADCRTAIGAARLIYADIGRSIRLRGYGAIGQRAVVSRGRKMWLLGRAWMRAWSGASSSAKSGAAGVPPSLEPAQFLVSACADGP